MFMPSSYTCCRKRSIQANDEYNEQLLDNDTLELEGL